MPEYTVLVCYELQPNKKSNFINILESDNGLTLIRKWKGNLSVDCYQSEEDNDVILLLYKWCSKENYENYIQMRKDTGFEDIINTYLISIPEPSILNRKIF